MKRTVIAFFVFLALNSYSQDSSNFQKLFAQFVSVYFSSENANPNNSYVDNLSKASYVLNPDNIEFRKAKKDLKASYSKEDDQWLIQTLTDSMVHIFSTNLLWKGHEMVKAKYERPFQIFLEAACPCYTKQILLHKNLSNISNTCDQELLKDPVFATRMNLSLATYSVTEKMEAQKFISRYLFENCRAYRDTFTAIIHEDAFGNYYSFIQDLVSEADQRLMNYFDSRKTDSLQLLFPDFLRYQKNIQQAAPLYKKHLLAPTSFKNEKDAKILTKTFIDNKRVLAQVIYQLHVVDDGVRIASYIYVPAEKISVAEKTKILKELEDIPPPMEIIKN